MAHSGLPSHLNFRTILRAFCITALVVLFVGYVLWQSRIFLAGPTITLAETLPATTSEPVLMIAGTAENIVKITLNGREIMTTADGYFKERVILQNGYTIQTLAATDRYGRVETHSHRVVYLPNASTSSQLQP